MALWGPRPFWAPSLSDFPTAPLYSPRLASPRRFITRTFASTPFACDVSQRWGFPPFIVDSAFRKGAKENAPDVAAREVGGEIYPARLRRRG